MPREMEALSCPLPPMGLRRSFRPMRSGVVVARRKLNVSNSVATGNFMEISCRRTLRLCAAAGQAEKEAGRLREAHRRKRWVTAFEACDEGNKGYLNREDYKVAVVMLFGYKPSKMEVDSVMASVQQSQSGISLDKFLSLMSTKKTAQLYHSEARHLFTAFDMQCKGFLSLEDFKTAFKTVAPKLPERTVVEAFREVDQDSDGHISFKEFESAMNYGQDDLSVFLFS
ncbi:EF-hand calcium-binding domain-containing protein 11 [Eublepharis macularius]|uniref:EF-hand calcium-binding domain-containing protein 11 n=1 Tax=Eublepharis macularius TaxID=481883 RepID=A0AA97IUL1_EUBMA|nr:EF-hand calcium-binding domain-containing protein 11 [Eublepharis macularius]